MNRFCLIITGIDMNRFYIDHFIDRARRVDFGNKEEILKLTILNRLKICFEVLTIRSGHKHTAQEKNLSTFQSGYHAGLKDGRCENSFCRGCQEEITDPYCYNCVMKGE